MDIKHPRRILFLGARDAGILDVVKDLTGSAPSPDINGSLAGLTHEWSASTAYYTATVPIWIDEITDMAAWKTEFLKEEAKEVVDAVGAWIFCFPPGAEEDTEQAMKSIQEVAQEHAGDGAAFIAVAKGVQKQVKSEQRGQEQWEDACMDYGFEYIDYAASGTNEFGEKQGFERLKEVLEANEWTGSAEDDEEIDLDDLDFDADEDFSGFGREEAEMTAELFGMKASLNQRDGEDDAEDFLPPERQAGQVDDLDRIMGKLLAVKEQSADLPEEQRKRMAAQAVRDLMNDSSSI